MATSMYVGTNFILHHQCANGQLACTVTYAAGSVLALHKHMLVCTALKPGFFRKRLSKVQPADGVCVVMVCGLSAGLM